MYEAKILGLKEAQGAIEAMIQEVESKPDEYWQYGAFAVVDAWGNLIAFAKMDGPTTIPVMMSIRKAYTSALWGLDTSQILKKFEGRAFSLQGNFGDEFTECPGGIAINEPGKEDVRFPFCIGAVGVGAVGTYKPFADKDEAVALVGAEYIQNALWPSK